MNFFASEDLYLTHSWDEMIKDEECMYIWEAEMCVL